MTESSQFDALVIGSGAGGMVAAARLAQQGKRVLVVETLDRLGGRASSREVDGFVLNTGALAIERDGPIAQLYHDLGLSLALHVPVPETVLLWGKHAFDAGSGPIGKARTAAPVAMRFLAERFPRFGPVSGQSTTAWVARFTRNKSVHGLIDKVCGAFFAASGSDLPGDVFLTYMSSGSSFKRIGFPPGGTVNVWEPLAHYIESRGGEVRLNCTAESIIVDDRGVATGAVLRQGGQRETIDSRVVVSNIGPLNTVELTEQAKLPGGYADHVRASTAGSAILTVHFTSPIPLVSWQGLALAGKSRRMTYAANFSSPAHRRVISPGLGPDGREHRYLYCAASTPRPATGQFDLEEEKALLLADIGDYFPGFTEHARILAVDVTAHDWPAQRAITGFDLPVETPIANVWNVGDGVKPWGEAGTAACARTGNIVAEQATRFLTAAPMAASQLSEPA